MVQHVGLERLLQVDGVWRGVGHRGEADDVFKVDGVELGPIFIVGHLERQIKCLHRNARELRIAHRKVNKVGEQLGLAWRGEVDQHGRHQHVKAAEEGIAPWHPWDVGGLATRHDDCTKRFEAVIVCVKWN